VFDEHYQVEYRRLMLKKGFLIRSAGLRGTCGLTTFARNQVGYPTSFKTDPDVFT